MLKCVLILICFIYFYSICHQINWQGDFCYAEIHYFAELAVKNQPIKYVSVATLYSKQDARLYELLSKTYISVVYYRNVEVICFDIHDIDSVVMIAPDPCYKHTFKDGTGDHWYYVMGKPHVKMMALTQSQVDAAVSAEFDSV